MIRKINNYLRHAPSLFLMLGASCAPTLAGTIKSIEGDLVVAPDARVNVTSLTVAGERRMTSLKVKDSGDFSTQEKLPEGEYLIEALVPGYVVTSKKVHIGHPNHVTLLLQPAKILKTSGIGVNSRLDQGRGSGGATLTPPTF